MTKKINIDSFNANVQIGDGNTMNIPARNNGNINSNQPIKEKKQSSWLSRFVLSIASAVVAGLFLKIFLGE